MNNLGERFSALWQEHSGAIKASLVLLLLAAVFYGVSLSGPVSSLRAAADLSQKIEALTQPDKNQHKEAVTNLLVSELESADRRDFAREICVHLAIAFVVAVIIIVTVESSSASRTRREVRDYRDAVAREVWQAIFGRLVPQEIAKELDTIMKATVVKDDCRYVLTLKPAYTGMKEGFLVIRREVTYTLRNITNHRMTHPINVSIHNEYEDMNAQDEDGTAITLPRHLDLKIDKATPPGGIAAFLKDDEFGRKRKLDYDINLGPGEAKELYLCNEEQARVTDQNLYVQLGFVISLQLFIQNHHPGIVVDQAQLHHPNWKSFTPGADGTYRHIGAILPGQSFVVRWHEKQAAHTVANVPPPVHQEVPGAT
jgi:hypothetical protein